MSRLELESLQQQLDQAIIQGSQNGDLSQARKLKITIETQIAEAREKLDPIFHLHPDLKQLLAEGDLKIEAINIGGQSKNDLLKLFDDHNVRLDADTSVFINSPEFELSTQPHLVQVVKLRPTHLNFVDDIPSYFELADRALKWGLQLSSPEVALYYRLHFQDQDPDAESLFIATKPFKVGRYRCLFELGWVPTTNHNLYIHFRTLVHFEKYPYLASYLFQV